MGWAPKFENFQINEPGVIFGYSYNLLLLYNLGSSGHRIHTFIVQIRNLLKYNSKIYCNYEDLYLYIYLEKHPYFFFNI